MKKCKIVNDTFSWVVEVDGRNILIQGQSDVEFIATVFEAAGYEIEWDREKWKRERELENEIADIFYS